MLGEGLGANKRSVEWTRARGSLIPGLRAVDEVQSVRHFKGTDHGWSYISRLIGELSAGWAASALAAAKRRRKLMAEVVRCDLWSCF